MKAANSWQHAVQFLRFYQQLRKTRLESRRYQASLEYLSGLFTRATIDKTLFFVSKILWGMKKNLLLAIALISLSIVFLSVEMNSLVKGPTATFCRFSSAGVIQDKTHTQTEN